MEKIDIQITDDKEYIDIATLVDKQKFLVAVERLRKKWGLGQTIPPEGYLAWKEKLYKGRRARIGEQKQLIKKFSKNGYGAEDPDGYDEAIARVMPDLDFECDIRDLRLFFNRPETFDIAIAYAVVCGVVPDNKYTSTYHGATHGPGDMDLLEKRDRVAIFVTPQTRSTELKEVMDDIRANTFNRKGWVIPRYSLDKQKATSNIKRDRRWYWKHLPKDGGGEGKSYMKIAKEEHLKTDIYLLRESIIKQIRQYQRFLQ
jgi:hypothetical protein